MGGRTGWRVGVDGGGAAGESTSAGRALGNSTMAAAPAPAEPELHAVPPLCPMTCIKF